MTMTRALGTVLALTLVLPAMAAAQERVGVATTVVGPVTIARVATPPAPLKFKDDVFLNDRITTGENGFARMLLGGKAIVTAREHSVVTITEAPGVSTVDLVSGRISVAVDKSRMRPGEVVEIKTPTAVAGIRGTIVIAEAINNVSTITVLRGLVDVYRRDPLSGNPVGPATPVSVRETVSVKGNVLPARPQTISVDSARRLSNDFTAPVRAISPVNTVSVSDEVTRAQSLLGTLTGGNGNRGDAGSARLDNVSGKLEKSDTSGSGNGNNGNGSGNGNGIGSGPRAAAPPTMPAISSVPTIDTVPVMNSRPDVSVPGNQGPNAFKHLKTK